MEEGVTQSKNKSAECNQFVFNLVDLPLPSRASYSDTFSIISNLFYICRKSSVGSKTDLDKITVLLKEGSGSGSDILDPRHTNMRVKLPCKDLVPVPIWIWRGEGGGRVKLSGKQKV